MENVLHAGVDSNNHEIFMVVVMPVQCHVDAPCDWMTPSFFMDAGIWNSTMALPYLRPSV